MRAARVLAFMAAAMPLTACGGLSFDWFSSSPPPPPPNATINLDSDPKGADAKTSLGQGCKTPCSLEIPTNSNNFIVTFTREGYTPQNVPVQIERGQGGAAAPVSFTPNPVMAKLAAVAKKRPAAKPAPKPAEPAPSTDNR